MNTLEKLRHYLDSNGVPYEVILHGEVYTAQELAQTLHTPGKELVKVVIVKADGAYCMAVLPASRRVDREALGKLLDAGDVAVAAEEEIKRLFPECEIGAMPPFGNLYKLEVVADESLAADETISFNAGTHYEAIRMHYRDFVRLAAPIVAAFTVPL